MSVANLSFRLDKPGTYTYDIFNDAGMSVLVGSASNLSPNIDQSSPVTVGLNFTVPDDGKLHLYVLAIYQAAGQTTYLTTLAGQPATPVDSFAFTVNTREQIVDGQQFLRVDVAGGPQPTGLIDYRIFSRINGQKVIELVGQATPISIPLPNLLGDYFVTATARRGTVGTNDDLYAGKVLNLTGISISTSSAAPTTSDGTTSLIDGCYTYNVVNPSGSAQDVSYIDCNGNYTNQSIAANQTTQICVLNNQYSQGIGATLQITPLGITCTPVVTSSSTTSMTDAPYLTVLNTTVSEGNTGSMRVRTFLAYTATSIGPFTVTVIRSDNSVVLGQVSGVAYPASGGIVVPISDYTGPVLVRAVATNGTDSQTDDTTASRSINVAPITATTTSSSTTSSGTTTSSSSSSSSSTTSAAFVQRVLRIQVKRMPGGDINGNNKGVGIRIQTAGGYQPSMAYSKTSYPNYTASAVPVSPFVDGAYQYGNTISVPPYTGSLYIVVGYMNTNNDIQPILVDNVDVANSDWVTVFDVSGITTSSSTSAGTSSTTSSGTSSSSSSSTTSASPLGISIGYAWDGGSGNYSFNGYANRTDSATYMGRIVPLSGQTSPTPSFVAMETGTYSAGSAGFNLRFQVPPIFTTPPGAAPGNWQLEIKRMSDGLIKTCPFTLVAGVNSAGEICPGSGGTSSSSSTTSSTGGTYYAAGDPITINT